MVAGARADLPERRFAFGRNWGEFASALQDEQLAGARQGLVALLGSEDLTGKRFLDVGSGSGLMSLAAHSLGASVTAFDDDPESVATTTRLRDVHVGHDAYPVLRGSVLDSAFVDSLGDFDVVYSWGVLHHTGDLWQACTTVARAVAPGGVLAVAVYNDQGLPSRAWARVKRAYVEGGAVRQRALLVTCGLYFRARDVATAAVLRSPAPARPRGMDRRHDLVDWVGGHPFQVARPEEVFDHFRARGFTLERLTTCRGGLGCNEFVFRRTEPGVR